MRHAKLFNNHSEYVAYMAGDNVALPNVSWCILEEEPHFTPYVIETKLVAKFNVTSTSEPTKIIGFTKGYGSVVSSIEIDDVVQPSVTTGYTFDTLGEHTVKYTLVGNTTGRVLGMCSNITDITIPNSVTTIGDMAFIGCTSLTSVTIPNSVTSIGDSAFENCSSLTSIDIPNSVTSISDYAFTMCTGLTSIDIPSGVTTIGYFVFSNCTSLSSITVDGDNATFDSRNNCNAVIETSTNELVVGCKDTIIPNTVTSIGDYAFVNCNFSTITIPNSVTSIGDNSFASSSITGITIPNSVTSIGPAAFRFCVNIESIEIPDNVTSIGNNAFQYSSGLTEVLVGTGITSIGNMAFDGCEKLENFTIIAATPPDLGYEAFYTYKLVIYVPDDYVETYKAAYRWSNYSDKIQPLGNVVADPVISCDGLEITITCATAGADIYYQLDHSGSYIQYSSAITMTADTFVQTYATLNDVTSNTVSETCEYSPTHDYSKDYLTFDVIEGGEIRWAAKGSTIKTISYSKDNGSTWTEITSVASGTPISVSTGDKVLFKGNNAQYATAKDVGSCFSGGTAQYSAYGNVMSLIGGDNFTGLTAFTQDWALHNLFSKSKVVSAKNLILPVVTLTNCCYRGMFANATGLTEAPEIPATTLATSACCYMFENCAITKAPELPALTVPSYCYRGMFTGCTSLNYIKCLATNISASNCIQDWVVNVSPSGTFVKNPNMNGWSRGNSGIPTNWILIDDGTPDTPIINFNGLEIELLCDTQGASIYYQLNHSGSYSLYSTPISINSDTFIECYAEKDNLSSITTSMTCEYDSRTIYEYSNEVISSWTYNNSAITTPYSVNAIDGHSGNYAKGTFNFETNVNLRDAEPTYLWFQHADQSASVYVDNAFVGKHWGGYNAFFTDITNYIHRGTNNIKVVLKNNEGNLLAPRNADFNFNATLGNVKLFTSPYVPATTYGYDGFHITSTVSTGTATINVATSIPTGATVTCTISGTNCNYTATSASTGAEMIFTTTITNPHLWNGTIDPYLYTVKLDISHNNELYHSYTRPYGLRFFEYVINDTVKVGTAQEPYTGFLLNGAKYLLRGVCMHDDLANKANALNDADYTQELNIIQELGCNFIRLAHYPHPKEVYDKCDQLGIVVQTEVPWVNKSTTAETEDYWTHLSGQCEDMVNQHYNHPCIVFWGVGNEINQEYTGTEDGKNFVKGKIESYRSIIRTLLPGAWVGYTISHSTSNLLGVFNVPTVDWVGGNEYVGWYVSPSSNDPTTELNKRISSTTTNYSVPCAFTEYGGGGTQRCHSDDFMNTTTRGNNPRHDIEYMMWLHEGHIAAIKNKPELIFTSQWQLFDIAVSSRQEGYKVCLDGETVTDDNNLKFLNNKGLVERDHVTKKDTFYLYKAWWNPTPFVHICGKNYTKTTSRVIKCYTNESGTFNLYVNGNQTPVATATASNNIVEFAATNFNSGDVIRVDGTTTSDTFTFD